MLAAAQGQTAALFRLTTWLRLSLRRVILPTCTAAALAALWGRTEVACPYLTLDCITARPAQAAAGSGCLRFRTATARIGPTIPTYTSRHRRFFCAAQVAQCLAVLNFVFSLRPEDANYLDQVAQGGLSWPIRLNPGAMACPLTFWCRQPTFLSALPSLEVVP